MRDERHVLGDALNDVEVDADRRMHEADLHRAHEKDAEPDRRQAELDDDRQQDRRREQHQREAVEHRAEQQQQQRHHDDRDELAAAEAAHQRGDLLGEAGQAHEHGEDQRADDHDVDHAGRPERFRQRFAQTLTR